MRKRVLGLCLVVVMSVLFVGCAVMPNSAVLAPVCVTQSPVAMGDATAGTSKVGTAKAEGILFVAFGDATISTAARNGGITRIHHVDSEDLNILGIYARQIIKVYGE